MGAIGGLIGIIFGWLIALAGTSALSALLGSEVAPDISIVLYFLLYLDVLFLEQYQE